MIWFIVNDVEELSPKQTTSVLIQRAAARGHQVAVCPVDSLSVDPGGRVHGQVRIVEESSDPSRTLAGLWASAPARRPLRDTDAVWIRTNPGRFDRPNVHRSAMALLDLASHGGVAVLNRPAGLQRAETKLYLHHLPESVRPRTLVAHRPEALRAFVEASSEPVVLKPISGTRGTDVFRVHAGGDNLGQIIDVLCRQGAVMAQGFVPEAVDGDVRVLLVNGRPLRVDGCIAAVRRRPPRGDFRSNVFRGGSAEPVERVANLERVVDAVGPQLRADGLFFVGLDLIGDRVVEVNVFSPGGVADMEAFAGVDFTTPILDAFEAAIAC